MKRWGLMVIAMVVMPGCAMELPADDEPVADEPVAESESALNQNIACILDCGEKRYDCTGECWDTPIPHTVAWFRQCINHCMAVEDVCEAFCDIFYDPSDHGDVCDNWPNCPGGSPDNPPNPNDAPPPAH